MAPPTSCTSAGSNVAPSASGTGNTVPRVPLMPCSASPVKMHGMPRRLFSINHFCSLFITAGTA